MSAPLDHTGPLDAVEDPGPTLLVVLVLVLVMLLVLKVASVGVEVRPPELLGPFEETTR
jgi:hypothetical protein